MEKMKRKTKKFILSEDFFQPQKMARSGKLIKWTEQTLEK